MILIKVLLEGCERQLVAVFESPIVLVVLLHCVVGQVDKGVVDVLEVDRVVSRAGAQVPLGEEVQVVLVRQENPNSDIELTSMYK